MVLAIELGCIMLSVLSLEPSISACAKPCHVSENDAVDILIVVLQSN